MLSGVLLKIAFTVIGVAVALTFKLALTALVIGGGIGAFYFVKKKLLN